MPHSPYSFIIMAIMLGIFPPILQIAIIADFFPLYMEKIHSFDEQQPLYSSRERNRKKNASLMPIKPYNYNIYTS